MIRFGWLSVVLLFGAVQGAVVAGLLAARRENRVANRFLALLLAAFVLRLVPYIIGYAGLYDAYPWLSFAPFGVTLAYGPFIYLYVRAITMGGPGRRWWAHLMPAAVQLAYYAIVFVQPLAFKNAWNGRVHEPWIDPAETVLTLLSLAVYVALAIGRYRSYQRWLSDTTSDRDEYRLTWLRNFLVAFAVTIVLDAGFDGYSAFVRRLSYFDFFWLYVWFAALVYLVGLEGWRHAGRRYPLPPPIAPSAPAAATAAAPATARPPSGSPVVDMRGSAEALRARIRAGAYARDPELTLAKLANELGMSAASISRAMNEGLGQNFNEAINRLRVENVMERLRDPDDARDVLDIAFEAGFSSKASFNRSFKAFTGATPTDYRAGARSGRLNIG